MGSSENKMVHHQYLEYDVSVLEIINVFRFYLCYSFRPVKEFEIKKE